MYLNSEAVTTRSTEYTAGQYINTAEDVRVGLLELDLEVVPDSTTGE